MLVGSAGYLATTASLPELIGTRPLTPAQIGASAVVAAGASLLPDIDFPESTIAHALGPVTGVLSHVAHLVARGHRQGTHGLLCAAALGLGLTAALASSGGRYVAAGVAFLCAALALRVLTEARGLVCAGLAAAVAVAVTAVAPPAALVVAVVAGHLLHLAADALTTEGVPLLWPVSKQRFRLPLVRTGDSRERCIAGLSGLVALYLLIATVLVPVFSTQRPQAASAATPPSTEAVSRVGRPAVVTRSASTRAAELARLHAEVRALRARLASERR